MNGWRIALAVTAVALIAAPLSTGGSLRPSDTYAYATYWEKRDDITVLLDSLTASFRGDQPFIPIPVAIGFQAYGEEYTITRESFYLIDHSGTLYGAASYEEVAEGYPPLLFDRGFSRGRPVTAQEFVVSRRVASDFYPPKGLGRRIDRVHLSAYSWLRDVIYFPRPQAGLEGVLTLRVSGGGIDPPIDVRFKVPLRGVPIR
jgi:hypothetical protein